MRTFIAVVLLVVPLAFLAAAPAAAEEIVVPPSAFAPTEGGKPYAIDQGGLGCLRVPKNATGFFVATVPAPVGATIEEVAALIEDFNPDGLGMLTLARRRPTAFDVIGMTPPSNGGGGVETLVLRPAKPVVVGAGETILLQVLLTGPEVCLHGVRVRTATPPGTPIS